MSGRLRQIVLVVAAVWLAMAALPPVPGAVGPGLDSGWVIGMNMAHTQGLVHGRDIVWTYGPLSYLYLPDGSGTGLYRVLAFLLGQYLVWCAALLRLCFVPIPIPDAVKAWMVILIGIAALLDPYGISPQLVVLTLCLLVLVDGSRWRDAGLLVISFLSALECLIKINTGVQCSLLLGAVLVTLMVRDVRNSRTLRPPERWELKWSIAGSVVLLPVAVVALYGAESGTIATFPAYIRNSFVIASGYSEAMAMSGPLGQALVAVIGSVVLFLLLPWLERPRRNLAAGYLPAVIYAFFSFKIAMVRQDGHAADFELNLALAALFLLVVARSRPFLYATAIFQVACVLVSHHYILGPDAWPNTDQVIRSRLGLAGNLPTLKQFLHWRESWAAMTRDARHNLEPLRASPQLASLIGKHPVEVLPWEVARVKANDWVWDPRPVFQSYQAYPASLDQMNAAHLRSGHAADFAILSWGDIDNRHPFLETPLAWQTQLNLYQTVDVEADLLVVGRRTEPRYQSVEALDPATAGSATVNWEQNVTVPQSPDPVVVSAQIEPSLVGSLRAMLFRASPLFITVTRRSGNRDHYRALRSNFADGVIMNQLPTGIGDLILLANPGCSLSDPVVSFRLETPVPGDFAAAIPLKWSKLIRRPETGEDCIAINPDEATLPAWGGTASMLVTAGDGVTWTGVADQPWIAVLPPPGSNGLQHTGSSLQSFAAQMNLAAAGGGQAVARKGEVRVGRHVLHLHQRGMRGVAGERLLVQLGFFGPVPDAPQPTNIEVAMNRVAAFAVPGSEDGDQPVMGDWTGNGQLRVGIFRDGKWYLDLNGNAQWDGEKGGDGVFSFGLPGDIAVPGDWAGDGKTRLGVFRKGEWVFDLNGNMAFDPGDRFAHFGLAGDVPVVGKWSHERADRVGVFRRGTWYLDSNGDGAFESTDEHFTFGLAGDVPLVSFGDSDIGLLRKGNCMLATNGKRGPAPAVTVACPVQPLIGTW